MTSDDSMIATRRPLQFGLRTLLMVTAFWALTLGMLTRAGVLEVVLVGLLGTPLVVMAAFGGRPWTWLLGFAACLLIAAGASPPDPASTLAWAMPLCTIYAIGVMAWKSLRKRRAG